MARAAQIEVTDSTPMHLSPARNHDLAPITVVSVNVSYLWDHSMWTGDERGAGCEGWEGSVHVAWRAMGGHGSLDVAQMSWHGRVHVGPWRGTRLHIGRSHIRRRQRSSILSIFAWCTTRDSAVLLPASFEPLL